MFDMAEFDKLVGTTRVDHRNLNWLVTKAKYSQPTKHTPAMVTLSGRVTDNQPAPWLESATTLEAYAYETIYV